jgi:uncharacterized protein YjdB
MSRGAWNAQRTVGARLRRGVLGVGLLALSFLVASCGEGFFHPAADGSAGAALTLPALNQMAAQVSGELAPLLARVNRVQVEVRDLGSGELLAQDDVQVPTTGDIRIVLEIPMEGNERAVSIELRLLEGSSLLFSATSETVLRPGESSGVDLAPVPVPGEVRIESDAPSFTSLGDTARVAATVVFGTGDPVPGAVATWRSTATSVVSVTEGGLATAVAPGTARLEAVFGSLVSGVDVEVRQLPASVELSPSSLSVVEGDAATLVAEVRDARENAFVPASIAWTSADPGVATVDGSGRVEGLTPGETLITAQAGEVSASVPVVVSRRPAQLLLEPANLTLAFGQSQLLSAVVLDVRGDVIQDAPVAWVSSSPQVVRAEADGTVRALAFGSAVVTATSGTVSAQAQVSVPRVAVFVEVDPEAAELAVGDSVAFSATVRDGAGAVMMPPQVAWASSSPGVVEIDATTGVAVAISGGEAVITASRDGVEGTAIVSVEREPAAVVVQPAQLFLLPEQTGQFTATVLDASGAPLSGIPVVWESANPSIAQINPQTGAVLSTGFGTTTVTATAGSAVGTAQVTVPSESVSLVAKEMILEEAAPVGQFPVRFSATLAPGGLPGNVRFRVFGGALGPEGVSRLLSYPVGSQVAVQTTIIDLAASVPVPGAYTLRTQAENVLQTSNFFDSTIVVVPAPGGLTATRLLSSFPFTLSWSSVPSSGLDYSYQVEYRANMGTWLLLDSTSDTATTSAAADVGPSDFVQFRIRTCASDSETFAFGCSPFSPPVVGQTLEPSVVPDLPPDEDGGEPRHDGAAMSREVAHPGGRHPPDEDGEAPPGNDIRRAHAGAHVPGPGGG